MHPTAITSCLALLATLLGSTLSSAADQSIPGQLPLMVVGDQFQYVHGSWAKYRLRDKRRNETSALSIAILAREKKKGVVGSWMEIGVEMQGQPRVLTRFLAEETPQGPGRLLKAVVDVEGFGPFSIPKSFLSGDKQQVGRTEAVRPVRKMERHPWTRAGKTVSALDIEALDDQDRPVAVLFSEEVPPLGLLHVDSPDVEMDVVDWGLGAESQIKGHPASFYIWLIKQVGKAMSQP